MKTDTALEVIDERYSPFRTTIPVPLSEQQIRPIAHGNKRVVRKALEIFTKAKFSQVSTVAAPDLLIHDANSMGLPRGPEGVRRGVKKFRQVLCDAELCEEDLIAEGDRVVLRWTVRGKLKRKEAHQSGADSVKPISLTGVTICRLREGRIAEVWCYWDP